MQALPTNTEVQAAADWLALFDRLPVGAYRTLADGRLIRANRALARLVGFDSTEELIAAVAAPSARLYVLDHRRSEIFEQLERDGTARGLVSEIYHHRTGERLWVSENAYVIRDAQGHVAFFEGTVEEVTESVHAHQALQRSEALLRDVTACVPGVVYRMHCTWDGRKHYEFVSEGVRELYGVEPEAVLADSNLLGRMRHPDDDERVVQVLREQIASGRPATTDFRICLATGAVRWVRLSASVSSNDANGVVLHGQVSDITASREAEVLRQERDRAEAADRAKSELMSRISHELRTPLNAVLGFAQLLALETADSPRHQGWAQQVIDSGQHLLELVDDVLDLTHAQAVHFRLDLSPVDLDLAFDESWSMLAQRARERQITLVRPGAPPGLRVLADARRLRQVLSNLLSNAIKYNRPGGHIGFDISNDGERVEFSVSDQGAGIATELLPRVFQPFERLGAQYSEVQGTGLGLALCKQLVEAMGGHIAVYSRAGEGTRLTVQLQAAA